MKSMYAFMKKEWMEQFRSSQFIILGILFILFGVMNPSIAKLTPWLMETMADSLEESGILVTTVTVTAMDSWVQFFKNIPLALIIFIIMESNIFTKEYQSGTLILALTKGLNRYKVVISKALVLMILWTVGYFTCFGITYGYNAYFWDNSIAHNLMFSVLCWWLFGLWVISLIVFFSTLSNSNTGVLAGTGGIVLLSYFIGLLPKAKVYTPTMLMDGNTLIYNLADTEYYTKALIVTGILFIIAIFVSIPITNRKQL